MIAVSPWGDSAVFRPNHILHPSLHPPPPRRSFAIIVRVRGMFGGVHESGRIFGHLPPASVAVSTGIGNGWGIAVNSVRDFVKVIMVTVGCPRIVLKSEPDPLTIPTPVFRLPRFGLRDHLIYRVEQIFIFRWIQSPSLVPAKAGSAGVYRKMLVESS